MWSIEPREGAARAAATAAVLVAVVAFLLLQELGLRLRREEHREWWAGSGRDLLNVAGLVGIGGALHLLGLSWAAALAVGGTLTLALFGLSVLVATQTGTAHPRAWTVGGGLLVALPVLAWPAAVVRL
ncbi:MAG TPA: hypothetical protein VD838_19420, partial [Anaeromyxobacteraceae bacterium]|nr:hypothetical protein [Anaeromyxobacteraceae bacterium]